MARVANVEGGDARREEESSSGWRFFRHEIAEQVLQIVESEDRGLQNGAIAKRTSGFETPRGKIENEILRYVEEISGTDAGHQGERANKKRVAASGARGDSGF